MNNYINFCFTKQEILDFANQLLQNAKSKIKLTEITNAEYRSGYIEFLTNRGAKVVGTVFQCTTHQISFRSLLKVKRKNARASWLHNGQPSTNTEAIVFNGETGTLLRAPIERFAKCVYNSINNPNWTEEQKQSHVKRERDYARASEQNVDKHGYDVISLTE